MMADRAGHCETESDTRRSHERERERERVVEGERDRGTRLGRKRAMDYIEGTIVWILRTDEDYSTVGSPIQNTRSPKMARKEKLMKLRVKKWYE